MTTIFFRTSWSEMDVRPCSERSITAFRTAHPIKIDGTCYKTMWAEKLLKTKKKEEINRPFKETSKLSLYWQFPCQIVGRNQKPWLIPIGLNSSTTPYFQRNAGIIGRLNPQMLNILIISKYKNIALLMKSNPVFTILPSCVIPLFSF